jgi:hypothetical protein
MFLLLLISLATLFPFINLPLITTAVWNLILLVVL